jgi:hypothetical protein
MKDKACSLTSTQNFPIVSNGGINVFYDFLNNESLDCNSKSEIKHKLNDVLVLCEKTKPEDVELCELEKQILFTNKSFEYKKDTVNGTVNGLSWTLAGIQTLENGSTIPCYYPDVAKLSKVHFKYCEQRYKDCKNLFIRTEYGLMMYFGQATEYAKHTDFKKQLCGELFSLAKDYLTKSEIDTHNKHYEIFFHQPSKSALKIAKKARLTTEIDHIVHFIFDTQQNCDITKKESLHIMIYLSTLMSEHFEVFNEKIDFKKVISKTREGANEIEKTDLFGAERIIEIILKMEQQLRIPQKYSLRYKAEIYEKLMRDGEENRKSALVAVKYAEDALRIYKSIGDVSKIDELNKKYHELRGAIRLTETSFELPEGYMDIIIEEINAVVSQASMTEILDYFVLTPWYAKTIDVRKQEMENREVAILSSIMPVFIKDKFGNTIKTFKTEEEIKEYGFWETYKFNQEIGTQTMCQFFIEACRLGKLSYSSVIEYLEKTWLNEPIVRKYSSKSVEIKPLDTLRTYLKRIFSEMDLCFQNEEYQYDCMIIIDGLTLKIEQLLRNFCEKSKKSTFRMHGRGDKLVMEKLIDDILDELKPEKETGFDEEDWFLIKYTLTEKAGRNLRNRVAHGLMDINEYSLDDVILLFCIIMKLSKYKPHPCK